METRADIAVIGGGAAGLAAAISAAQTSRVAGSNARIVVLEADERVGRSILKTGNGRCNFSNAHIAEGPAVADYCNASFVRAVYAQLNHVFPEPDFNDPVLDFFETLGLEWRQEEDGRRYPLPNKASAVLDVLRAEVARLGVEEVCGCAVQSIEAPREVGKPFTIQLRDGQFWRAQAVVLACGGAVVKRIQVTSAPCVRPAVPVLGPLRVAQPDQAFTRELDNIRVRCCVSLFRGEDELILVKNEVGELLFRPYGVSGICVFNLSRYVQAGDTLQIDFLQMGDFDQARDYIDVRYVQLQKHLGQAPTYEQFMRGLVLPRVADVLLKQAGLQAEAAADTGRLFNMLCMCSFELTGETEPDQCQVHRGGYAVEHIVPESMEMCQVPGLFVAGEAVDVDGPCGGYNLHWAWASGMLAGHAAMMKCE